MLIIELSPTALAVHDSGLGRVQPQPDLGHPVPDRQHHRLRLRFGRTVHHGVIGIALEGDGRVVLGHPAVEQTSFATSVPNRSLSKNPHASSTQAIAISRENSSTPRGGEESLQTAPAPPIPPHRRVLVTKAPQLRVQPRHQRRHGHRHSRPPDHLGPAPCRTGDQDRLRVMLSARAQTPPSIGSMGEHCA